MGTSLSRPSPSHWSRFRGLINTNAPEPGQVLRSLVEHLGAEGAATFAGPAAKLGGRLLLQVVDRLADRESDLGPAQLAEPIEHILAAPQEWTATTLFGKIATEFRRSLESLEQPGLQTEWAVTSLVDTLREASGVPFEQLFERVIPDIRQRFLAAHSEEFRRDCLAEYLERYYDNGCRYYVSRDLDPPLAAPATGQSLEDRLSLHLQQRFQEIRTGLGGVSLAQPGEVAAQTQAVWEAFAAGRTGQSGTGRREQ